MNPFDELKKELSDIKQMIKEKQEPEELLTVDGVASLLHVHRTTVYELVRAKKLTSYPVGNRLRFKRSEVINSLTRDAA